LARARFRTSDFFLLRTLCQNKIIMAPTTMTPVRRSARVAASRAAAAAVVAAVSSSTATATTAKKKKTTTAPKKKTKTHGHVKSSPPAKKKQKHTGLQATVDSSAPLGVIDPASHITDGSIMTLPPPGDEQEQDGAPADAMLVLVDPAKNHDKFFVLQCIERAGGNNNNYCVYSRWGRTGTAGQALQQDFDDAGAAQQVFEAKFRQKTGLSWSERHQPYQGGMYRFIVQDFIQKQDGYANGQWQYYVDDGVDGKVDGWYDYDANGSVQVEILYHQHAQNPQLSQRQVASGYFTYHVDLDNMTQTNTSHPGRKSRRIRRVVVEADEEEEEEEEKEEEGKEEESEPEESTTTAVSPPVATPEPPVTTDAAASTSTAVTVTPPRRPRRRGQAATSPTPVVSPSPARSSSSSSSAAGASASS
jgi:predicted DNA-binding WGR domain protein